jgi:hypothetical protein
VEDSPGHLEHEHARAEVTPFGLAAANDDLAAAVGRRTTQPDRAVTALGCPA